MRPPENLDPLAEKILRALAGQPQAAEIVLGGYLALQHYLNYRQTRDIDAWWRQRASPEAERAILAAMQRVAADEGLEVRERRFGETLSVELVRQGQKRFSFQIAVRTIALEPALVSAWPPILIETLADNIGSKMNALVERGAPRDFLDIRNVVQQGLVQVVDCWQLWTRKNPGEDVDAARQKALLHLSALDTRRPLASIKDVTERDEARRTREWFRNSFLSG
ncbi:MAG TPA: nucleotidyl transferase AbiEii/AbiGii toxin family protein [Phycisphaerae bacterium]|jgi:hypothetical protein